MIKSLLRFACLVSFKNGIINCITKGLIVQEDIVLIPNLVKSAVYYSKRYLYRTISEILHNLSLDEWFEDNLSLKN